MIIDRLYRSAICSATLRDLPNPLIFIMLKLFAKYTSTVFLTTRYSLGRICFCVARDAYASGAGELFPFCYRCIAQLLCHRARFTFNASTHHASLHDVRGGLGTLSRCWLDGWTNAPRRPTLTLVTFSAISLICGFIYSKVHCL